VILAFVVDSSGRAEMPSASFIQDAREPEFRQAICAHLQDARFVYPPGVQPRRALVVTSPVHHQSTRRASGREANRTSIATDAPIAGV
jgi:hypothetical protein